MNKLKLKKIIERTFFAISILLFVVGYYFNNFNIILCGIMLTLINNIAFSLFNIRENIVFCVFNITFFTLLLSGNVLSMLSGDVWYNKFSDEIEKNTLLLLFLSLGCIFIGAKIYGICKEHIIKKDVHLNKDKKQIYDKEIIYIRKLTGLAFFITLIPPIIMVIEKIVFINQNTYLSMYTTFSSKIPFIIQKLANTNFTFFMLYLSTFPKKNNTIIATIIYGIYLILSVFTGERGTLVVGTIVLAIYYIYRQYTFEEKYISKKNIIIIAIIGIVGIIFLSSYNVLRNKEPIENFNPIKQFKQFFIDQSTSVDVISNAQKYKEELPETNSNYTFGILINVVLNKDEYISKSNTLETAMYGNNLGSTLSYLAMGQAFFDGHGMGTQYIAELYTDFSYLGVIIYNIVLGFSLIALININNKNYIGFTIGLNLISNLVYLPRQFAMGWTTLLLSSTVILSIAMTFIISRIIRRKIENENSLDS